MKKFIYAFLILGLLAIMVLPFANVAYAESGVITDEVIFETITEPVDETEKSINDFFDKYFSAEAVTLYISALGYLTTIILAFKKIITLTKQKGATAAEVGQEVKGLVSDLLGTEISAKFNAVLPKILETQEKSNAILTSFAKILALSQENTPESRVAILNLIQELGVVSKEVVDNAKEIVIQGQEIAEAAKEELDNKIDEIVESYDGTSI